ncbi:MAG: NAD(P)H-dependent oxidoreductase subunit E [Saprospiraceae bacterium]|nr:NAD(P)H-dependent oxidoreductase subunit E [Saprospiraceae bacterium]
MKELFHLEPARSSLLNRLWELQHQHGFISDHDITQIAAELQISSVEVEGVVSFYHFFHRQPSGKYTIYLDDSIIAGYKGYHRILEAFERETGTTLGSVDRTGTFGLFRTPCIGLSDQSPAALINFRPFTQLNVIKVKDIIQQLRSGADIDQLYQLPPSNVCNTPYSAMNIFFRSYTPGSAVRELAKCQPDDVIRFLRETNLSGRGGAFYPTWKKWEACRSYQADHKFIVCNADEGEPGTFKDRVLLQDLPGLLIEGMIISAFAVGAQYGIIYLRGEYGWLQDQIQKTIDDFNELGLLGSNISGIKGFNFQVRIQLGAGAYVCGEETAMLESMEGHRDEPRTKWFYPVEKGYLQYPTIVNNVETLCAAARIVELGVAEYNKAGLPGSPGTKLISVSGDCNKPGVYELPWGITVAELLELCNAVDPNFIQVSGPSGECISISEKFRRISMLDLLGKPDLRCGGSFMIFNKDREIIDILLNFASFFKQESCGICTPCRSGNFIIERKLEKLKNKLARQVDIDDIVNWGHIIRSTSRCGLGKTSCNSLVMAMQKFGGYFDTLIDKKENGQIAGFNMDEALADYEQYKS